MKLNYKEIGEGKPLIILHGLFGSSDNWISIGRSLAETRKIFLVDQRNHGHSPHSNVFTYEAMATDLKIFIEEHSINEFDLIGHSLGGKTAMLFATKYTNLVDKLIVVDIAPKQYPVHHDTILEGLKSIDLDALKSRGDADKALAPYVPILGIRQFLLKNLKRTPEGFSWKINLAVIEKDIEEVGKALPKSAMFGNPTLFIRGGMSNYIVEEDIELIHTHFPTAQLATVKGASHWVHAEKPKEFLEEVNQFLNI
ncbi:MAG: alpha/beta fold hydrolase [Cyclobacteriaceae bacterium]|nr:alpha/beta fold hydrolase [Cyclobacteriaceae bacterium]